MLGPGEQLRRVRAEPNPETKKKDVVWFALDEDRPLFAFAGMWMTFNGDRDQVEAGAGAASGLRLPDDIAERGGRADPSEGNAGDPDDRREARRVDTRIVG